MQIRIIYPDPLLKPQLNEMERINNLEGFEAHFEGMGNGEVEMIINKQEDVK